MKKVLLALPALAVLAASCNEINGPDFPEKHSLSLKAVTEQPFGTRTVVSGETQVFWEPGDEIAVFADSMSARFVSSLSEPSATADFEGSLDGAWSEGDVLWAVYPYAEEAYLSHDTLSLTLPSVQTARAGSFAQGMNISVARSTTSSLQFFNVGGGLRFSLGQDGIREVVLEGMNGEILAGDIMVGFEDGRPVVLGVTGDNTTISLAAPEGETLQKDTWYYIVALPGSLDYGFKLYFYKGNEEKIKAFDNAVTVKRSVFGSLEHADEGVVFPQDVVETIAFADAAVESIAVRYFDTDGDGGLSYDEAAAVSSFLVDEALTKAGDGLVSVFAGSEIQSFDELIYFTGLTEIEEGVFAGCTGLTSVIIPANITGIGANAFNGCTALKSVTLLPETPPALGEDAFAGMSDFTVHVPKGSGTSYLKADGWKQMSNLMETGVEELLPPIWGRIKDLQFAMLSMIDRLNEIASIDEAPELYKYADDAMWMCDKATSLYLSIRTFEDADMCWEYLMAYERLLKDFDNELMMYENGGGQ